jgi:hypothetical protein
MSFQNGEKNPFTETSRGEQIFQKEKFPSKMQSWEKNQRNGTRYACRVK